MLNNATIDKLLSMRFSAMADAFRIQQDDPSMKELDFDERFGLLVDAEYSRRKSNRLKRLIKDAGFEEKDACIAGIDYQQDRSLNRQLISRLATCDYITEYRNIFITGKSGSGKTYLACAFGMAACMKYYKVKFVRFSDLLIRLKEAEDENKYFKVLKEYVNPRVLILDEWLLNPITNEEARYVLDLIHKRRKKSSTIFCSQYEDTGWYAQLGGDETPLADSIMDRIAYDSYKINIRAIGEAFCSALSIIPNKLLKAFLRYALPIRNKVIAIFAIYDFSIKHQSSKLVTLHCCLPKCSVQRYFYKSGNT